MSRRWIDVTHNRLSRLSVLVEDGVPTRVSDPRPDEWEHGEAGLLRSWLRDRFGGAWRIGEWSTADGETDATATIVADWSATPRDRRSRKPIALTLGDDAQAELARLAKERGQSRSEVVEDLILRCVAQS